MGNKLGSNFNKIKNKPVPGETVRHDPTPLDTDGQGHILSDKNDPTTKRITIRLDEKETAYFERMKEKRGLNITPAFHEIMYAYMRQNPL